MKPTNKELDDLKAKYEDALNDWTLARANARFMYHNDLTLYADAVRDVEVALKVADAAFDAYLWLKAKTK